MLTSLSPIIKCPECGTEIPLNETIAAPLIAEFKADAEERLQQVIRQKQAAEERLAAERQAISIEKTEIEALVASKLAAKLTESEKLQRDRLRAEIQVEIDGATTREKEANERLKATQLQIQEALSAKQKAELDASAAKAAAQLEVQAEVAKLRELATKEAQDAERLKVAELEEQIKKLLTQVEDATRQAQQGSQQRQGETLELDLEVTLRQTFPWDEIEPVKTGQRGGDLVHRVMSGPGQPAGTMMWEIKRTLNWGGDWCAKAKQDALSVKAEVVIIVSEAMPKGIESFGCMEGVWVCRPSYAVPLAHAMRQQMDQVSTARRMAVGKQGKAELLYDYVIGPEFKARVQGIAEPFVEMQRDLDSEKRATLTWWKKRERQIERVLMSATSMMGDFQGIGGREMPDTLGRWDRHLDEMPMVGSAGALDFGYCNN